MRVQASIACVFLVTTLVIAQAARQEQTVVIGKQCGLKIGEKLYVLGSNADEFMKAFGPPDSKFPEHSRIVDYRGDGLKIHIDEKRKIGRIAIYFVGWGEFRASSAATAEGFKAGSLPREVMKAYGAPTKDETSGQQRWLHYPWGFALFENESLSQITIELPPQ